MDSGGAGMNTLKPCPFCGEQVFTPLVASLDDGYTRCISCGAEMQRSRWQTRPIEDDLRKRIAELEEKQRWRVVANGELPEDGEVVWLWDGNNLGMGYYLVFSGQFMDRYTPLRPIKPSHWMPLPESPEVQE